MSSTRLSPESWITAGFKSLAAEGPASLAAEPLARKLGTTKGSFYWHFKDVSAFHKALLREWESEALAEVMTLLRSDGSADQRLRDFGQSILQSDRETALRVWAHSDRQVADILAEVDEERLKYLNHLLSQMGLRNPAFAYALLATLVGLPQIQGSAPRDTAYEALVDTVLALS